MPERIVSATSRPETPLRQVHQTALYGQMDNGGTKKKKKNKNGLANRLREAGVPPPRDPMAEQFGPPTPPRSHASFAGSGAGSRPPSNHDAVIVDPPWDPPAGPPPPPPDQQWYGPPPDPSPFQPFPPRRERFMTPLNHYDLIREMSTKGEKGFGGLHGDSAALNWALGLLTLSGAICVLIWARSFLQAYAEGKSGRQNYAVGYYMSQYALALAILTIVFETLYIGWVFADARHPMRKAWQASSKEAENLHGAAFAGLKNSAGNAVNRPGLGTRQMWSINRLTVSRLFAEKKHIAKLRIVYGVFFLAWLIPFLLMTFKDGYLTWKRLPDQNNVQIAQVCGEKRTHETCMELARAGIGSGALAGLFLVSIVACTVAQLARKTPKA